MPFRQQVDPDRHEMMLPLSVWLPTSSSPAQEQKRELPAGWSQASFGAGVRK